MFHRGWVSLLRCSVKQTSSMADEVWLVSLFPALLDSHYRIKAPRKPALWKTVCLFFFFCLLFFQCLLCWKLLSQSTLTFWKTSVLWNTFQKMLPQMFSKERLSGSRMLGTHSGILPFLNLIQHLCIWHAEYNNRPNIMVPISILGWGKQVKISS